jgi:selenocysteine-specific elongation factor
MHVLATAGHVDHGKSTLVRALTGMEPDRFAEARRRGLTIDLGYAWTTLPGGAELAFVDVPGHERFIGNMLAGLGPAPGVLFVVAADEGWARQSDEHLAAVDALDLRHGLLAVTRSDLADPATATKESLDRIERSSLGAVEAVAVSGTTGAGLDELRAALGRLAAALPVPDPSAPIRFWIDRAFSIRGSGTVVTGTLTAGTISTGDRLLLGTRSVTVRAIQSLGAPHDRIAATARVALNLRGVATDAARRGDALLSPERWHHTQVVDARLNARFRLPADVVLHLGTAALPVRLRPLGADTVRITLPCALPVRAGDRAVLRDPSRHAVAAGVLVVDADPPPLTRRGAARLRAAELATAGGRPDPTAEIARRGAVPRRHLHQLGIDTSDLADVNGWLIGPGTWRRWTDAAPLLVARWAETNPVDPRMPLPALQRALALPDEALLAPVLAATDVQVADGRAEPAVAPTTPAPDGVGAVEKRLRAEPFRAPDRDELDALGLGRRELAAAERAGRLWRVSDDIVLLPDAAGAAVAVLRELPQPFTTSQARAALDSTRRVVIPLLECLDRLGRTERVDSQRRRVRPGPGAKAASTER